MQLPSFALRTEDSLSVVSKAVVLDFTVPGLPVIRLDGFGSKARDAVVRPMVPVLAPICHIGSCPPMKLLLKLVPHLEPGLFF